MSRPNRQAGARLSTPARVPCPHGLGQERRAWPRGGIRSNRYVSVDIFRYSSGTLSQGDGNGFADRGTGQNHVRLRRTAKPDPIGTLPTPHEG